MRLDTSSLLPAPRQVYQFTAREPGTDDVLELSLSPLDPDEELMLPDRLEALVLRYVTGDKTNMDEALRHPAPVVLGNRKINMSRSLIWSALNIEAMQVAREGEEPYTWMDFCKLSKGAPHIFRALIARVQDLTQKNAGVVSEGSAPSEPSPAG